MASDQPRVEVVAYDATDQDTSVVLVDRIEPGQVPPYCTHGRTTCIRCQDWCWLGSETMRVVRARQAVPLCLECAPEVLPPNHPVARHLADHRRAHGPHTP